MGYPYTSKFVLFDEAQLNMPPAASLEELKSGLYDLFSEEIAQFDDLDESSIELDWIASERLDASMSLESFHWSNASTQATDWTTSFSKVLSVCTGLPDFLIDADMASGSKTQIKEWLLNNLETGASFRQGLDDVHKSTLWSLKRSRVAGFVTDSCYYDSQEEDPCDARLEDFGNGQRIIVEMRVY